MKECSNTGCTKEAADVVGFVDPPETVEYCTNCGVYEYKRNGTAVGIMPADY